MNKGDNVIFVFQLIYRCYLVNMIFPRPFAAQCIFRGVEFHKPHDYDIEELKQALGEYNSTYAAQFYRQTAAERGIATVKKPGCAAAIRYVRALGTKINSSGNR